MARVQFIGIIDEGKLDYLKELGVTVFNSDKDRIFFADSVNREQIWDYALDLIENVEDQAFTDTLSNDHNLKEFFYSNVFEEIQKICATHDRIIDWDEVSSCIDYAVDNTHHEFTTNPEKYSAIKTEKMSKHSNQNLSR